MATSTLEAKKEALVRELTVREDLCAALGELREAKEAHECVQEQLEAEHEAHREEMLQMQQKVVSVLSERIKELKYRHRKARVRDLWLRGII